MKTSEAVERYEVLNIHYSLSQASQTLSPHYVTLNQKRVTNDTPFNTESTVSVEITESVTREWSITAGAEVHVGVAVSVTGGIPLLAEATSEWEVGFSASFSFTYGKSFTTSKTTSHEVTVDLPAYSDVSVAMIAKEATVSVPYTATLKVIYKNGNTDIKDNVKGIYRDVHQTSFETTLMTLPSTSGTTATYLPWPTILLRLLILNLVLNYCSFLS